MTLHDVLRDLVRHIRLPNESDVQERLLAIDAHEAGYPDSETYAQELRKRAALAANPDVPYDETPEQRAARLEARNAQLEALLKAQAPAAVPTVPPSA